MQRFRRVLRKEWGSLRTLIIDNNTPPEKAEGIALDIMKLTEHFELREFIFSLTAQEKGIDNSIPVWQEDYVINNLRELCMYVLEPLRKILAQPIYVSSGYRSPRLNEEVGGADNSQHLQGFAADVYTKDLSVNDEVKLNIVMAFASTKFGIPFDQLIVYDSFVHVSYVNSASNRSMIIDKRTRK